MFLGFVVRKDGLEMDQEEIKVVQKWPTPNHITLVRGYHGLENFYRRLVKDFSSLVSFIWEPSQEQVFKPLKEKFT